MWYAESKSPQKRAVKLEKIFFLCLCFLFVLERMKKLVFWGRPLYSPVSFLYASSGVGWMGGKLRRIIYVGKQLPRKRCLPLVPRKKSESSHVHECPWDIFIAIFANNSKATSAIAGYIIERKVSLNFLSLKLSFFVSSWQGAISRIFFI